MRGSLGHDPIVVIPSPEQGAALRHLGMLSTDEVPMVAAHWLTDYDSPELRRLAGLNGSEGWLIDRLWPEALSGLGVAVLSDERAWDLSVAFQLAAFRAGDRSMNDVMSQVIRAYIESDYPRHVPEAGELYGLDDELNGGWGRTPQEVLEEAEQTLTEWAERGALRS
jgi:hypothetical protein